VGVMDEAVDGRRGHDVVAEGLAPAGERQVRGHDHGSGLVAGCDELEEQRGRRGVELLFQVITAREERASIAIATNLPFSEWGTVFPDPRLVAAIVDRVTFNAHILETGTQSYRLRTSKTAEARRRRPHRTPDGRASCGR